MASTEKVIEIIAMIPPATLYAQATTFPGASTPAEVFPAWAFDDSTKEYMDFLCRMGENYEGGGLTLDLNWVADSAVTGTVRWDAALRRLEGTEDWDVAHTYDFNSVSGAVGGTLHVVDEDTVTFTAGADMDSVVAGDLFILRVARDVAHADDDMVGDAWLVSIIGKET